LFYDNLKTICDLNGFKISPIVKECGGAIGSIDGWRKGATPNSEIVKKLSLRLNVSTDFLLFGKEKSPPTNDLSADERELLTYYKKLDTFGKGKVIGKAEALAEAVAAEKKNNPPVAKPKIQICCNSSADDDDDEKEITFYDMPVSAGTGVYLSGNYGEPLRIRRTALTDSADFALRISGDSMEPFFRDGNIAIVRYTPSIEIGDIGIFIINNEGYIKKYDSDRLISLNKEYDDILFSEYDDIRCQGRVLGVLSDEDILD